MDGERIVEEKRDCEVLKPSNSALMSSVYVFGELHSDTSLRSTALCSAFSSPTCKLRYSENYELLHNCPQIVAYKRYFSDVFVLLRKSSICVFHKMTIFSVFENTRSFISTTTTITTDLRFGNPSSHDAYNDNACTQISNYEILDTFEKFPCISSLFGQKV